jgi:enamine deaminase RidA (YjgF/YER057c/UK114 family)
MFRPCRSIAFVAVVGLAVSVAPQEQTSPAGVRTLAPPGAIRPTGTWSLGTRAGDFVFIAGMRGIDPATNQLVAGDEPRVRQAFRNMELIAKAEGAGLQEELWGQGPYPPRTILEVQRLNQDDIVEVEGTFYASVKK